MSGFRPAWLTLDVSVFCRPPAPRKVGTVRANGVELACLDERALTRENVFGVRFEDVVAELGGHPRVDVEPDGFFVGTGEESGRMWKLNGHLFELNDRLWRMDLRGGCPEEALDEILRSVGWPATAVVFQLVRLGATVEEGDFRRWAAGVREGMKE